MDQYLGSIDVADTGTSGVTRGEVDYLVMITDRLVPRRAAATVRVTGGYERRLPAVKNARKITSYMHAIKILGTLIGAFALTSC